MVVNDGIGENKQSIPLSSGEIAFLWAQYMNDTLAICVMKYFKQCCQDQEILPLIETSLSIAANDISIISDIFSKENFPLPIGFTDEDVDVHAPRLFSDIFILVYIQKLQTTAIASIEFPIGISARSDVSKFFNDLLKSVIELHDRARTVMLNKGVYVRPPQIPAPDQAEFIEKQSTIMDLFGQHKRPLSVIEITVLFANTRSNVLGKALMMGFAQVSKSKEVKQFFLEGKQIADKHATKFNAILSKDDLPVSMGWESHVTASTVPPFSEKLMMHHTTYMNAAGLGNYGTAVGACQRVDLSATFTRLAAEVGLYAEEGASLMIKNGWMEEPPKAVDRKRLVNDQNN